MRKFAVALAAGALALTLHPVTAATPYVQPASASLQVAASDPGAPRLGTSPGSPLPSAASTVRSSSPTQQVPNDTDPNALKPGWILLIVVVALVLLLYAAEIAFLRSRRKK